VAKNIAAQFHGKAEAREAVAEFDRVFRRRGDSMSGAAASRGSRLSCNAQFGLRELPLEPVARLDECLHLAQHPTPAAARALAFPLTGEDPCCSRRA